VETRVCEFGGPPETWKEFQYIQCLSEMVVSEPSKWEPSRLSIEGDWKSRMWSIHKIWVMEV
jgi:hypothetical protein